MTKTTGKTRRNPNPARHSIWRAPNGMEFPLEDAPPEAFVLLVATEEDRVGAIPGDPNNCVKAKAWCRSTGAPIAQFGIDKCYLPIKRGDQWVALRVKSDAVSRAAMDLFDETGEFPPDGFWFRGIPLAERLDSQRSQQKRTRERWHTIKDEVKKPRRVLHLRNASRRAQVVVTEDTR